MAVKTIIDPDKPIAAVDLGSNSFHMIVARVEHEQLVIIDRIREMVRLAEGLDEKNHLDSKVAERAIDCLSRFGERLQHIPSSNVRIVGTNTLRKAKKAKKFLKQAEGALGHKIGIISGIEEARLVYLGVSHSIADNKQRRLVIDIGGGSTELIIGEGFKPLYMESLFVGCVSMSQSFFTTGDMNRAAFDKAEMAAMLELEPYISRYRKYGWNEAVGSSGTIRSISKVLQEHFATDGVITLSGLEKIKKALIKTGDIKAVELAGLSERRRPVFPGGVAVLTAIFRALKIEQMQVSSGAVREGLLYELLGRTKHHDVRDASVDAVVKRFGSDLDYLTTVKDTAESLFNKVAKRWKLNDEDLALLGWAALLHEIGLVISHDQYHKHGDYILKNMDLPGFSRQEQQKLGILVRGHRRSMPVEEIEQLSGKEARKITSICVLLRLAVLLHRGRTPLTLPDSMQLKGGKQSLAVHFPSGWMDEHPLTMADLKYEAKVLSQSGFELSCQ